jgi:hypothetical protein
MLRPLMPRRARPLLLCAAAVCALFFSGCRAKIGDACNVSTDCSLLGDRICDLSKRVGGRGECTIEGCGRNSCPKEAACVKAYGTDFLSVSCDPDREDKAAVAPEGADSAPPESLPPHDDCLAHEVCLPEGLCADEVSARTSCRRKCSEASDCRGGYECRITGSNGIYHTPDPRDPNNDGQIRICMPISG